MEKVILEIYQAKSSQWAGVFYGLPATDVGVAVAVELGRVGGCSSPDEVYEAVADMYEVVSIKTV